MATGSAIVGAGLGIYQAVDGAITKNKAKQEMANYDRYADKNAYEDMPINTTAYDNKVEQDQIASANMVDLAQNWGLRGIMGALPQIQANTNANNRENRDYLGGLVNQKNYAIAQDNVNRRQAGQMIDQQNLAGISSQINAGNQDMWSGFMGFGKSALYGMQNIDFGLEDKFGNTGSYQDQKQAQYISKYGKGY